MQVTTEIDFELDLDDTMREIAEEVMEANCCQYLDKYDVQHLIDETYNDAMAEYLEAAEVVVADDLRDLENEVAIARRAINVLLEERERTLGRRARRFFTLTCSMFGRMVRRVHWHMPRR